MWQLRIYQLKLDSNAEEIWQHFYVKYFLNSCASEVGQLRFVEMHKLNSRRRRVLWQTK